MNLSPLLCTRRNICLPSSASQQSTNVQLLQATRILFSPLFSVSFVLVFLPVLSCLVFFYFLFFLLFFSTSCFIIFVFHLCFVKISLKD
ncbi:unnamed protein product [Trifolium pratense]|uniref:Uncharacterized protein n=1 Tax=Trifolium pratense TaxID=57577 RepID=A0ACB0IEK8_TRIPR|nr:unnamed protein product [Trifolium pratense]